MLIPVMLGISFILYAIMTLTPGDPAQLILGPGATQEAIDQLRAELGTDVGFWEGYVNWLTDALHGEFGTSYRSKEPVFDEVFARFPNTLKLASSAIIISVIFGLAIGIFQAVHQYSLADNIMSGATLVLTSMPDFWIGLILIIISRCTNVST